MKEFYISILENLKELAGVNQVDLMMREANQDKEVFKSKLSFLISELCNVSNQFQSMPFDEQKKVIRHSIMTDKEFKNLNVRWVYGLLSVKTREYLMTKAEDDRKREEREIRDATGCDPETAQKYLNEWKQRLSELQENRVTPTGKGAGSRLRDKFYGD